VKTQTQEDTSAGTWTITELRADEDQHWDAFVASQPDASLYHLTVWRDLIQRLFGHRALYLYARDGAGKIVGILPIVRLKSRLFGDFLTSMPYLNYGGAIAVNTDIEGALMNRACELAEILGCGHIEFRDSAARGGRWPVRTDKVAMELTLPESVDELWGKLSAKIRAQIKRPARENMTVEQGRHELLGGFYRVFARNMRDLGTPVYPPRLFSMILDAFPDKSTIIVVRHGRDIVAAGFLLGFRDRLEIPWASSIRDYNRFGVNMLLYWEALQFAIKTGYQVFDLGRSTRDSGTHRFKAQWGSTERQLYWHYWLKGHSELPELTPSNPKYRIAIRVWQHLPISFTTWLGPKIVKNLP
jgi:serine/alanine adding enzyme